MNVIIPMAGIGKRLRLHTLTVPKPLIPIAGKPIVQRLVEDIVKVCKEPGIPTHPALEAMKNKGTKFEPGEVSDWLDCGNKNATVITNNKYLEYIKDIT